MVGLIADDFQLLIIFIGVHIQVPGLCHKRYNDSTMVICYWFAIVLGLSK